MACLPFIRTASSLNSVACCLGTEVTSTIIFGARRYADRILKGAEPSELPVQAPIKFELVINLNMLKALGLDVPLQLQQRADEVIE